jgi:hypothetical protein
MFAEGEPKDVSQIYFKLQRDREHAYQEKLKKRQTEKPAASEEIKPLSSNKTATMDGEFRFGLNTAQIVDFKVFNHEDVETYSLETGKKFKVWMKVIFHGEVKNPALGILIKNPQGQNLLGLHSYHEKRLNFGVKKEGDQLTVTFESLMLLNPGRYTMTLTISDHSSDYEYKSLDVRNNVVGIGVYKKTIAFGLIHNNCDITIE